jgi:DNA-binding CsgD family transcriptional regulator/tetratricopeptide (TPR) repeat protein
VSSRRNAPFVGRQPQIATLDAIWRDVTEGAPAGVLISGEAGVGKSRLVSSFVERRREEGAQILLGNCVRLTNGALPYGPIVDALRRLVRERRAESLSAVLGPGYAPLNQLLHYGSDPGAQQVPAVQAGVPQSLLFELMLGLVGRLSDEEPLVFLIEDVHWAEQSTLDVLSFLTASLSAERIMLVATYRDDEPSAVPLLAALAELLRNPFMTHLPLAPFLGADFAALLDGLTDVPLAAADVARLQELSGGNAFFAEELVEARTLNPPQAVPGHVRDVVILRLTMAGEDLQLVARRAAVVGRRVSYRLLARITELPEARLDAAIRQLVQMHVLLPDDEESYTFRHALTQEAVYGELLPGERARVHEAVARALTEDRSLQSGPEAELRAVVAHHWRATGNETEELRAVTAAGRAAMEVRAYAEGLSYFKRATVLWDRVDDPLSVADLDRADVLFLASQCANYIGEDVAAARLIYEASEAVGRPDDPRRALMEEARGRYLAGLDGPEALRAFQSAYDQLGPESSDADRARVTASLAQALSIRGKYADSAPYWEQALELARAAGCKREEVLGLRTSGWHLAMHGNPETGIARMREAVRVARAEDDVSGLCVSYNHLCLALDFVGRSEESLATAEEALRWADSTDLVFTPMLDMRDSICLVFFRLGQWSRCEEVADRLRSSPLAASRSVMSTTTMAEIATASSRLEDARTELDRALAMLVGDDDPLNHGVVHAAVATEALWSRDYDRAAGHIGAGLTVVRSAGDDQQAVALCALGVRIQADEAERCRDRRDAAGLAAVLPRGNRLHTLAQTLWDGMGARQSSFPEAAAELALVRAEHSRLHGDSDPAAWADAVKRWADLDRPYPTAYARWREAEARAVRRDPEAKDVLTLAHAGAVALGATALDDEIRALAARRRIRLTTSQAPRKRADKAPTDLTDREDQVLQLVSEGRTDQQIADVLGISKRTVSVHVSRILDKFGVKNRVEASARARHLGLDARWASRVVPRD